jgi:patatin-like phospholipase/acyl hydrolase
MAFRILSIDGGGIRGVIPAIWLSKIQDTLEKPLSECFDLMIGTSTGSIVAAAASIDLDIKDTIDLYSEFGPKIFPADLMAKNKWTIIDKLLGGPVYSDVPLEDALKKLFGLGRRLGEANTRLFIPSYDVYNRSMYNFRSYVEEHTGIPIWEACKASSSAPTYFPAHVFETNFTQVPLIDGGVFANNPTLLGIAEAVEIHNKDSMAALEDDFQIVVVSLGTGNMLRRIEIEQALEWGPMNWVRPVIDVLFDGSSEVANHCARLLVSDKNYIRVQVSLHQVSDDLDDASQDNIIRLKNIATHHIEHDDGPAILARIATLLGK